MKVSFRKEGAVSPGTSVASGQGDNMFQKFLSADSVVP
jgi:hypothetical protein